MGTAQHTHVAERVCGDGCAVIQEGTGVLVAVVDGLGHGEKAAEASQALVEAVEAREEMPVGHLIEECHRALGRTRGAAAALMRIDTARGRASFAGVGNIHVHSVGPSHIAPVSAPGVLGHRVRKFLSFEYDVAPGTAIAIASDGISSRFHIEAFAELGAQEMADAILEKHGQAHDDATIVVLKIAEDG